MSRLSWNPNKLFGRLSIRTKLAVAFMGLSGASLLVVGWYAGNMHLRSIAEGATNDQRRGLAAVQERVQAFLDVTTDDLNLLADLQLIEALLDEDDDVSPDVRDVARRDAESFLRDFIANKPRYYRLRLLGSDGTEVAHTVVIDGVPTTIPAGRWRSTGFRYYTSLLGGMEPGQIAFAPVQLRGEPPSSAAAPAGPPSTPADLSVPIVSALSFARPIREPSGELRALLIADVYARSLFELLEMIRTRAGEKVFLVGPEGEFLFRSDRTEDWNTLLADPGRNNLRQEFPDAVATLVLNGGSGMVTEGLDAVVTFTPLLQDPHPSSFLAGYTLLSVRPAAVVFAPVREMRRSMLFAGAVIVLVAGLLAVVGAHQFAAPIRALTAGATRLARGEFDADLQIATNDEIEDLANTFNSMAAALRTREEEIVNQREQLRLYADHLETMVDERTRELRRSQRKMVQQEKMVAVGQLAAGVAHELGTPLASILCHAQMAQEELADIDNGDDSVTGTAARLDESLELIESQVNRCSHIVRKLLDFSRPSSYEQVSLQAREVIDGAIELLRHDLDLRGIDVDVQEAGADTRVTGNRNELEQVFVNLLRNGADAMPDGGRISVRIDHHDSNVRLIVADEGEGIEPAQLEYVFDPFYTTKGPGVGTGLGLWVVYNTVTSHGGRVDIDSAPEQGTRVTVTLPALAEDSDRGSEP